jgi:DNA helicase-2/ATP-dependent DNA helicase PcrA
MDENGVSGLEEERRLAYVGITRARKRAYIFFAANRLLYGNWVSSLPSRFIEELPKEHVEVQSESGLYKQAQQQQNSYGGGYDYFNQGGYGPGFARKKAELVDYSIEKVTPSLESEAGFGPGMRVFHQKFGYGTVVSTDHDKLDIKFDKAGRKKVIDSFVAKAD